MIDYPKPLKFRNVHTATIPETPNLEEIKKLKMLRNLPKGKHEHNNQLKIMTPRSTKNVTHNEIQRKKSFKNITLELNSSYNQEQQIRQIHTQKNSSKNHELCDLNRQMLSDHKWKQNIIANVIESQKQNNGYNKNIINAKKKPRMSNPLLFKEVKSTKMGKHTNQQCKSLKGHNNSTVQLKKQNNLPQGLISPSDRNQNQSRNDNLPYANEFESSTYHNHYKVRELCRFKQEANEFANYLNSAQNQIQNRQIIQQELVQKQLKAISIQFDKLIATVSQIRQKMIKQIFEYTNKMKDQYRQDLKKINSMKKSIIRYLADIDYHYDDIVKELDLKQFEVVINTYGHKLQYFNCEMENILVIQKQRVPQLCDKLVKLTRKLNKYYGYQTEQRQCDILQKSSRCQKTTLFTRKKEPLHILTTNEQQQLDNNKSKNSKKRCQS